MVGQKKIGFIEVSNVSGGVNSIENAVRIGENQVQPSTIGAILKRSGFIKYPGALGLSASTTFADYLRMMAIYREYDTTEHLMALSAGKLYEVNKSTGALTEKFNLGTAANYGSSCESYNKMFVCNGTSNVVKIEGSNCYRVGIAPPSGVTATASAGAGLPDGVYSVNFGYARKVGGVNVLYSSGQTAVSVTLGSGNNRISVSNFTNSSDGQVGNKVVWIKSPGEVIHYFFYETNDNTTTSFTITSTAAKSTSTIYEVNALDNGLPPSGTYIYSFANMLWLVKDNVIYYSARGYTAYDIEKFPAANVIVTPYNIKGIFSVGFNLYFNTESGIAVLPNGDPSSALYLIEPRWHFFDMNTVARWNNGVIGLTIDGVKFFDGQNFTNYDISYNIKNYIDKALVYKANFPPCGFVYRRGIRNEYHLLWQDTDVSSTVNNIHAILNLDSMVWASAEQFNSAWEFQNVSGNFAAISRNLNALYIGQTHASASKIYAETPADDLLNNLYLSDGTLLSVATNQKLKVVSRIILPAMHALCWMDKFRVLLKNNKAVGIKFTLPDQTQDGGGNTDPYSISALYGGSAAYDVSTYDGSYYPIENAFVFVDKFPENFSGREISLELTQEENDPGLQVLSVQLQFTSETGNFL